MDMATALAELGVTGATWTLAPGNGSTVTVTYPCRACSPPGSSRRSAPGWSCAARVLHPRANGQQLDQRKYIRPQTLARLSPAARFILDV
jgi:hypothetical protein